MVDSGTKRYLWTWWTGILGVLVTIVQYLEVRVGSGDFVYGSSRIYFTY